MKAFTLLELLLVLLVISILAAMALPALANARKKSKDKIEVISCIHSSRINAALRDDTNPEVFLWTLTNSVWYK